MADTELSALTAASALDGTEKVPILQTTAKAATVDQIATHAIADLMDAASATPTTGDFLIGYRVVTAVDTAKTFTLDTVAEYAATHLWADAAATDPVLLTDTVIADRSGTKIEVTIDTIIDLAISTYNTTAATAASLLVTMKITALSAATPDANDLWMFNTDAGVPKKITTANLETQLWTDFATYEAALWTTTETVADGDIYYFTRAGAAKAAKASEIATYVQAEMFGQTAGSTPAESDTFVMNDVGTGYRVVTAGNMKDYISPIAVTAARDLSTLSAGAITDGDLIIICRTTTPYKEAAEDMATYVLGKLPATLTALTATTAADANLIYCTEGGVAKKITFANLAVYCWAEDQAAITALALKAEPVGGDVIYIQDSEAGNAGKRVTLTNLFNNFAFDRWTIIDSDNYTATPASTSQLTMSDTTGMASGLPLRYTIGGTDYYGVVNAVSLNTSITVKGAPLSGDLTALAVGQPNMVHQMEIDIPGAYLVPWKVPNGTSSEGDMLAEVARRYVDWRLPDAYLVAFSVTQVVADSTVQPKFNVKINGNAVGTENTNTGPQVSATPGTWTDASAVAINTSNYDIVSGDPIEVLCTASGGSTGEACDLSIVLLFVYE